MTPDEHFLREMKIQWDADLARQSDRWTGTEQGTSAPQCKRLAQGFALQPQDYEGYRYVSMERYQADVALWSHTVEGWRADAAHWFQRYESMRRGSFWVMLALAVETVALVVITWGWYAG